MSARGNGTHVGDLAKRVAHRREELGLTLDEVARRAGMDSGFLDYLEHSSAPSLTIEALTRLAFALETTVTDLAGGDVDRPPGTGRAGPHPSLEVLSREQCEAHLAAGDVGPRRVPGRAGPGCGAGQLPLRRRRRRFRTDPTGPLASPTGATVGFEVDHIDEAMSEASTTATRSSATPSTRSSALGDQGNPHAHPGAERPRSRRALGSQVSTGSSSSAATISSTCYASTALATTSTGHTVRSASYRRAAAPQRH
jgi:transcriptional regulator with XRE-family HTH domain